MIRLIKNLFHVAGLDVVRYPSRPRSEPIRRDISSEDLAIIDRVRPYTMTSIARLIALIDATRYIVHNDIPGDIAECGVWRGGSIMAVALTLIKEGDTGRRLYLYDTYEGMSAPTECDTDPGGMRASDLLAEAPAGTGVWCVASFDEVQANVNSTGYPTERIVMVKGKVEETIPGTLPKSLSLLRVDTDWYESTKHELKFLYPVVVPRGCVIIDDYGHWQGARRATDEFFATQGFLPLLQRVDYTGRVIVKP